MALIKCSECGREISITAEICPWCGHKKIHIDLQYFKSLEDITKDEEMEELEQSVEPASVRLSMTDMSTYTENAMDFSVDFSLNPGEIHIYDKGKESYQRESIQRDMERIESIAEVLLHFIGERSDSPRLYSNVDVYFGVYRKSDDKKIGTIHIGFLGNAEMQLYYEARNFLTHKNFTPQETVAIIKANKDAFKLKIVDCRKSQNNSTDTNGLFSKISNFFAKLFKRN